MDQKLTHDHSKPLRVLMLSGGHRYLKTDGINVGDIAQLEHAVLLFNTNFPGSTITLLAHSLNDGSPKPEQLYSRKLISFLLAPSRFLPRIAVLAYRSLALLVGARFPILARGIVGRTGSAAEVISEFKMADVLVVSGSGTLSEQYVRGPALIWCIAMLCAKALGTPVLMLGQQIGPLQSRLSRGLIKLALRNVEFIGVRDEGSADVVLSLGVPSSRVRFTGDEGFYLPPADKNVVAVLLRKMNINMPFIAAQFRVDGNCPFDAHVGWFADALSELSNRIGAAVVFVPFSYASHGDDREACRLVAEKLRVPYAIFDNGGNSAETKAVLEGAELAIGVANHFCVFAASVGVPTVGVYATNYMAQKLAGIEAAHGNVTAISIRDVGDPDQFAFQFLEKCASRDEVNGNDQKWRQKPLHYFDWLPSVVK